MVETLTFPDHLLGDTNETFQPMSMAQEPRVRRSKFGDGYEQRVADGINNAPQMWPLSFTRKSGTDVQGVYDFILARGGEEAFFWTPRGEASPRKFVCRKWTRSFDEHDVVQGLRFTLEEVFE